MCGECNWYDNFSKEEKNRVEMHIEILKKTLQSLNSLGFEVPDNIELKRINKSQDKTLIDRT